MKLVLKNIPTLISALNVCPTATTLSLYRGYDWTKHVINAPVQLAHTDTWSLYFYKWKPEDNKHIDSWKCYEHSFMPIHNPLLVNDILLRKWQVKTADFETPKITTRIHGHREADNFSLHLFGRKI